VNKKLIQTIQFNCDVSDAKDHGIYSMCTMVLKLRNLYKWENNLEPWEEPESADLLDWIEDKEHYWATMADEPFRPLNVKQQGIPPFDLKEINNSLESEKLVYGAGYGRSMKTVFFLAELLEQRMVEGCPVAILGKEKAKEMAGNIAMVQDGLIIIRKESLRFFLWDQIQELRSSCRSSLRYALHSYDLLTDENLDQERFKSKLDSIVEEEMNFYIYHEVGEMLQTSFDTETLQKIIGRFPGSLIEFLCRSVKDVLADCHPQGLLSYVIREKRASSLGFYAGFLDGLRKQLFPEMSDAWQLFLDSREWIHIEQARSACWEKNLLIVTTIKNICEQIGIVSDDQILNQIKQEITVPLGLQPST
jgi:hypothetical protein